MFMYELVYSNDLIVFVDLKRFVFFIKVKVIWREGSKYWETRKISQLTLFHKPPTIPSFGSTVSVTAAKAS